MRGWRGRVGAVALCVMAVGLTSCGTNPVVALPESGATLEGEVKYDGKPIHFGLVVIEAPNGSASGNVNQDGTYKVENVPLGEVRIAVVTHEGMSRGAMMAAGANKGPDAKAPGKVNVHYIDVPKHYHETGTSGITKTVEKGTNKFDIVLDKPKPTKK